MSLRYNIKNKPLTTSIYFKPSLTPSSNLDNIKLILENDRDFIYSDKPLSYQNATDYIYRLITNSRFLCKGLNADYVAESFDNVDAVVILSSSKNVLPNGNLFGFALINFDETSNYIYIDVICSHIGIQGAGDILIKEIQNISKTLFMTEIHLTSVDTAISFYEKYGFIKQDSSCTDMCLMIKSLLPPRRSKRLSKSRSISKSKTKSIGKTNSVGKTKKIVTQIF